MTEEIKAVQVFISGRVQGVWFRESTRRAAERMGLSGWVRNLADGRVEAFFQGPTHQLENILAWCHKGPSTARVTDVTPDWREPEPECVGFTQLPNA